MVDQWTAWKKFPEPRRGEHLDAPVGPGVYELRRASTGEMLGFGHSANVAATLTRRMQPSWWRRLVGAAPDVRDVEYRTMAASSASAARDHVAGIERRRQVFWSRIAMSH